MASNKVQLRRRRNPIKVRLFPERRAQQGLPRPTEVVSSRVTRASLSRNEAPATATPSSSTQEPRAEAEPKPSSSAGKRQKKANAGVPAGKRRRPKRQPFTLFPAPSGKVSSRPNYSLAAQLTYVVETLPKKMEALKKNSKMCHAFRVAEMQETVDNLIRKRLGLVCKLMIDRDNQEMMDKKDRVKYEMQERIKELLIELATMESELAQSRKTLKAKHGRNVCCAFCAKKGRS